MNDKTKMNMAAAKMLGMSHATYKTNPVSGGYVRCAVDDKRAVVFVEFDGKSERPFDIFTNPADCLAAVKSLGVEHGVYVARSAPNEYWVASNVTGLHGTYEEAAGAACVAVVEGE